MHFESAFVTEENMSVYLFYEDVGCPKTNVPVNLNFAQTLFFCEQRTGDIPDMKTVSRSTRVSSPCMDSKSLLKSDGYFLRALGCYFMGPCDAATYFGSF